MSELKFVCPKCGDNVIEEVLYSATVIYEVSVDRDGDYVDVSAPYINDGEVERYQCRNCNFQIGEDGEITSSEQLAEWLLEQDYNKEQKDGKQEA